MGIAFAQKERDSRKTHHFRNLAGDNLEKRVQIELRRDDLREVHQRGEALDIAVELLIEAGVFDSQGDLVGEDGEHAQVFDFEWGIGIQSAQGHHAEDLIVAVAQGHADRGADFRARRNPFQAGFLVRVGNQHWLAALRHSARNPFAERHRHLMSELIG